MNSAEAEKFRDKQVCQKYNLIHLLPTINVPELSGLYLKSFLNATKRYRLQLPSLIEESDSKFCGSCGCVRIHRINAHISTIEVRQDNLSTRELRYKCLNCQHVATFPLENTPMENLSEQNIASEKFTATWPRRDNVSEKVDKKSSSKARAKKRKMNSLSNLLSRKNQQKEKRSVSSLSLESFMQRE